jgi:hypothetical protein
MRGRIGGVLLLGPAVVLGATAPAWAGSTERISFSSAGKQANNDSADPSLSADGRFVAFSSAASNLVRGDTNKVGDVFVRDRKLGTTQRVSVTASGRQANGSSYGPRRSRATGATWPSNRKPRTSCRATPTSVSTSSSAPAEARTAGTRYGRGISGASAARRRL